MSNGGPESVGHGGKPTKVVVTRVAPLTVGDMVESRELLDGLRTAVADNRAPTPTVRAALATREDPSVLRRAGKVLAGLRPTDGDLRPVRVAVHATTTIGSYEDLLRAVLVGANVLPELHLGPYAQFDLSLRAGRLGDGEGEPDVVSCLLDDGYFLPADWNPVDVEEVVDHVRQRFAELRDLLGVATHESTADFVVHTVPLSASVLDSVISWRARARLARAWHQLNADLLGLAEENPRIAVADLVAVLAERPVQARDDRLHFYADLPYTDEALLALAEQVGRFVRARSGLSRKVLALDLDNTLWGGVLGEVGAGGLELGGLYPGNCYQDVQRSAARLRDQGVVLVLVSKNDAEPVDRVLAEHPAMLLRRDAFSAVAVNWSTKVDNLRACAESLGLAIGSFVFVDDSPFERGHVEQELPEVAVVASDGDPAGITRAVLRHGWFDVPELTSTDRKRPELYRTRALRADFEGSFGGTSEDYLHALHIELTAAPATEFTVARIAQLGARTNQFNLTGLRYDAASTASMAADPAHLVASFAVRDRFGDDGVIGAAWVERGSDRWTVTNLVLSCRVLGRDVEIAIAAWLADQARAAGARTIEGRFVPSDRNGVAADFWQRAGFHPTNADGVYELGPDDEPSRPAWITLADER